MLCFSAYEIDTEIEFEKVENKTFHVFPAWNNSTLPPGRGIKGYLDAVLDTALQPGCGEAIERLKRVTVEDGKE